MVPQYMHGIWGHGVSACQCVHGGMPLPQHHAWCPQRMHGGVPCHSACMPGGHATACDVGRQWEHKATYKYTYKYRISSKVQGLDVYTVG